MRVLGLIFALLLTLSSLGLAQNLSEKMEKLSYSAGVIIGKELKNQGLDSIDFSAFTKGMQDMMNDSDLQITEQDAQKIFQQWIFDKRAQEGSAVREAGEKFLAENAGKEGVITLPSGLQYIVLKEGDGPSPMATDKVKTHYHGTLVDGTVFDSSVERGEPISFPVNGVIQAWQEILPMMKVGSKYKIFAPYQLAYGERGAGGVIKPFSALIFEIELLGINVE
jgi:FKBP-type peptidyl-prolyl cis-trans isomerase FklB